MKYKTKIKIGISLLIALFFIVPSGAIMAGESDAGNDAKTPRSVDELDLTMRLPGDEEVTAQAPGEIIPLGIYSPDNVGPFNPMGWLYGDIPEGTYDLWTMFMLDGCFGPGAIKVFLEVYRKCCGGDYGEEIIMYEESFEDNYDIYNNWIQVDQDCGMHGQGNAYYDGWTHSDARASDGEYSFKCTMYDIYKGNQDDILEFTGISPCLPGGYIGLNITPQTAVNVSFDIWVDGSGDTDPLLGYDGYRLFDFLSFEIGDQTSNGIFPTFPWTNPDNLINGLAMDRPPAAFHDDVMIFLDELWGLREGSYHFFDTRMAPFHPDDWRDYTPKVKALTGGWWHVWYQIDIADLQNAGMDTDHFKFRFRWQSDPENQFEGAYVDNIKVVSLEGCEEKVFQTHTQGPVEFLDPCTFPEQEGDRWYITTNQWGQTYLHVDFPLDWDAIDLKICKKTCYDFKLWVQLVDPGYGWINHYDWPNVVDIPICVGDFYDCGILDAWIETSFGQDIVIPVGSADDYVGLADQGEDLHITTWVHLQGTVPTYDVPVTLRVYKKQWKNLGFWDFESGSAGWEFGHFGAGASLFHVTDYDAYSGNSALGCFDEDTKMYRNNMLVDYALHGATYDVRDYIELELSYYTKFITEGNYPDFYDYWAIMLYDAATNFVLGNIGGVGFPTQGFFPDWMGPDEPRSRWRPFDLIAAYDYWHDVRGFFRNDDASDAYELGCGFAMWGTDYDINFHALGPQQDPPIYWSGLYFDDISVDGLEIGEEVYTEVIIVPEMIPCFSYEVQFEWEDVPYSDYLIVIECEPEGGCDNWPKFPWKRQVRITSEKENLHPKEVESIDYTSIGEGEFVISSSDYDNYIATNAGVLYSGPDKYQLKLCPDHGGDCGSDPANWPDPAEPCCIEIYQQLNDGVPVVLDMDMWWEIEGAPYDWLDLEFHPGCPSETSTGWVTIDRWPGIYGPMSYIYEPDDGWLEPASAYGIGPYDLSALCTFYGVSEFSLRFVFQCDAYWDFRGAKLDNITISNFYYGGIPPAYSDFLDCADNLDNWCTGALNTGQFWFHKVDRTFNSDHIGTYCNFNELDTWMVKDGIFDPVGTCNFVWPFFEYGEGFVPDMDDGLIWTTEIADCYKAWLRYEIDYEADDTHIVWSKLGPEAMASSHILVEISDGTNWWVLSDYNAFDLLGGASFGFISREHDISFLAGNPVQIRFRVVTDTEYYSHEVCDGDFVCIRDVQIYGKQDHTAPMSTISMTGTMKDSGWFNTAVRVKITASDNIAMGEIHYILDGVETVVPGEIAEFTVSGNGLHTLEFWAVDAMGNVEPHNVVPPFRIDSGSPPTVAITAPEPGLYLFGNKILSASKVIIIGAFTIEATASDAESGIYKVQFYLDGDVIAEDTELPFSAYCAVKHMGEGTIKVVAEDFAQNTAEDTLDVTYYKFL